MNIYKVSYRPNNYYYLAAGNRGDAFREAAARGDVLINVELHMENIPNDQLEDTLFTLNHC